MPFPLFVRLPDEARSLPPPPLINRGSVWLGFAGWLSVLLSNAIHRKPVLGSGIHKQLFGTTVGFYVGHYLTRRAEYFYARRDRDIAEYIQRHPEDFKEKEKRTVGQLPGTFQPVR